MAQDYPDFVISADGDRLVIDLTKACVSRQQLVGQERLVVTAKLAGDTQGRNDVVPGVRLRAAGPGGPTPVPADEPDAAGARLSPDTLACIRRDLGLGERYQPAAEVAPQTRFVGDLLHYAGPAECTRAQVYAALEALGIGPSDHERRVIDQSIYR